MSTFTTAQDALDAVAASTKSHIFERGEEVETALLALVSGRHHLTVGPPGIAKSLLPEIIIRHISGVNYFHWLMGRFTTPEEIFGPPRLSKLREDIYERNIEGKLPWAHVAFLDECWKSSTAILNSLLTIANEGWYFNNGRIQVPLSTIFFASNELPRDPELAAMWDRVTFRHEVAPMRERGNFQKMLRNRITGNGSSVVPIMTWDQVLEAQEQARKVDISESALDALDELRHALAQEGVTPTDRRFNDCVPIIQANAFRQRRDVADQTDLKLLRHVLWVDLKDQGVVSKHVLEIASPLDREALEIIQTIDSLENEARKLIAKTDSTRARQKEGLEIDEKLKRAVDELEKLTQQSKKSSQRSDLLKEAKERARTVAHLVMQDVFGLNLAEDDDDV